MRVVVLSFLVLLSACNRNQPWHEVSFQLGTYGEADQSYQGQVSLPPELVATGKGVFGFEFEHRKGAGLIWTPLSSVSLNLDELERKLATNGVTTRRTVGSAQVEEHLFPTGKVAVWWVEASGQPGLWKTCHVESERPSDRQRMVKDAERVCQSFIVRKT